MNKLSYGQLDQLADDLAYYDIDQMGWEQGPNGMRANAEHVQYHLAKDVTVKDFADRETVRTAIAPDALQYGLRLVRWSGFSHWPGDKRAERGIQSEFIRSHYVNARQRLSLPTGMLEWMEAGAILANNSHSFGHASEREQAEKDLPKEMVAAAGMLLLCADNMAEEHHVDLEKAFHERLFDLRNRFGIPQPS